MLSETGLHLKRALSPAATVAAAYIEDRLAALRVIESMT